MHGLWRGDQHRRVDKDKDKDKENRKLKTKNPAALKAEPGGRASLAELVERPQAVANRRVCSISTHAEKVEHAQTQKDQRRDNMHGAQRQQSRDALTQPHDGRVSEHHAECCADNN